MLALRMRRLLLALLVAIAPAGCSRVQFAYQTADFVVELYANRYLTLDNWQLAAWRPTLEAALAYHRSEELPYIAAFFDRAVKTATAGFSAPEIACLLNQAETLYRRHARLVVDTAVPLLGKLSAAQIAGLKQRFAEQARADTTSDDAPSVARRQRKRAERYAENFEWLIGPLSAAQTDILKRFAAAMPDTASAWYAYRDAKRFELVDLLRRGADEARLRRFMAGWLVEFTDLPEPLVQARAQMRQGFADLLLALDPTFSAAQREHLIQRLGGLRDDFTQLQEQPRSVSPDC